jgi:hypothetical protein
MQGRLELTFEVFFLTAQEVKVTSPDYKNVSPEQACEDFKARIKLYETQYEPLCLTKDDQVRFLKVVNTGRRFIVNRAEGERMIVVNVVTIQLNLLEQRQISILSIEIRSC